MNAMKSMFTSWKTALPGALTLVCGASEVMDLLPDAYQKVAIGFCMMMVGLGLVVAKDADRSNAPAPTAQPQKVTNG